MENSNEYQCKNCGLIIPLINKEFHLATCSNSQQQSQMEIEDQYITQKKQYDFDNYPKVQDNYKKEKVDLKKLKKDPHPQDIICPKCTLPLKINQLEEHQNQCNYNPCRFCREYYPQEFIDNHEQQCYKKGIERQNSYEQQQQQNQQNINLNDQNDLLINQQGRQYITRRITQRTPNGFVTSIQTVPINQINHQDPWYIINRSYSNQSEDQDQDFSINEQIDPQIQQQNQFQGQQQQPFGLIFNNLFHRNDNFFRDFTNHGNFMRMNRHLINLDILSQLLEQLRNPQQGMDQNQVNQIPKKQFQKNPNTPKGEEEKCSICLTEYNDGDEIRQLPCKHLFHPECVDTWLVQNSHCPICKNDLLKQ